MLVLNGIDHLARRSPNGDWTISSIFGSGFAGCGD
jgi:hypothetical protein